MNKGIKADPHCRVAGREWTRPWRWEPAATL